MSSLNLVEVTVTSSGLTIATTAYTAGDILGAEMAFNMGAAGGLINSAILVDASDVIGAVDLFLYDSSVNIGTDNAAPSGTDATGLEAFGKIEFPQPDDMGGYRQASLDSMALQWTAAASNTIYGRLVTRTGHTFFGAATALQIRLLGSKDV